MNTSQSTMNPSLDYFTFSVPLMVTAHTQAREFVRHQSNRQKAQQVYLNTLAVYAVNFYLQCQDIETDLEASSSWNPVMQTLLDVADLEIKDRGKLECISVVSGSEIVKIPAEVWDNRIGYVVVQLDESWQEATLLGFIESVNRQELPLSQLRSLAEFPAYLDKIQLLTDLTQWLEGVFAAGWQTLETLLQPRQAELAFSFRKANSRKPAITRGKVLDFGLQTGSHQLALLVDLVEGTTESDVDISVEVCPTDDQLELPPELQLIIFNEEGKAMMQAEAGSCEGLKFEFSGEPGERFGVKVALSEFSVTENFLI